MESKQANKQTNKKNRWTNKQKESKAWGNPLISPSRKACVQRHQWFFMSKFIFDLTGTRQLKKKKVWTAGWERQKKAGKINLIPSHCVSMIWKYYFHLFAYKFLLSLLGSFSAADSLIIVFIHPSVPTLWSKKSSSNHVQLFLLKQQSPCPSLFPEDLTW